MACKRMSEVLTEGKSRRFSHEGSVRDKKEEKTDRELGNLSRL